MARRVDDRGLSGITRGLLVAAFALGILHHIDHILRVDHSGWPFREVVTPFTFSLFAYPILLFALLGPRRWFWARWALLAAGMASTLFAHIRIESPQMQYAMWAYNPSLEPELWNIRNLCGVESGFLGVLAVGVSMALNIVLVTATMSAMSDGVRGKIASDIAR